MLKKLHWLPVEQPMVFKTATLVYKFLHTGFPRYFAPLLSSYTSSYITRCSKDVAISLSFQSSTILFINLSNSEFYGIRRRRIRSDTLGVVSFAWLLFWVLVAPVLQVRVSEGCVSGFYSCSCFRTVFRASSSSSSSSSSSFFHHRSSRELQLW